ncbi:MAG: M3 family oligoendopeptidase, partial [Aggregatilineales bacterium]
YESVLESQLAPNNIPLEVFHNLIDTFRENIGTWHRYWEVKRNALGVDKMRPYDIWAPLVENEPEVSYEQAVQWVADGMMPLGEDYVEIMRKGCLEERWVDYAVNKGKRQGAFSYGSYDTAPYIMMSFNNNLKAMSTLAHELGHSMHSYYSRKTQPQVYAGYTMFVAEVASNFNQALTRAKLFETQDDKTFQIALIEEAMSNFHRYFFIMPTLARFEFEVHSRAEQGKPLSADILNGIMSEFYAEGYGDTMTDDADRTGITWAQFGHLYVPYYTFQYSTGISAAHALADDILAGDESARKNYREFLSLGGSVDPIDALNVAGIDMSTPAAVKKTYAVLGEMVERLAELTS